MTTKALSSNNGLHPGTEHVGLKKLCTLLRNEGDRVLNGSSAFTLTSEVLTQLNHDCRRHSITESDITTAELPPGGTSFLPLASRLRAQQAAARAKEEWSGHVQFIKDFMLSTPSLKLIRYSGTISSPVSLDRFGNLTCLQLRKVPIHMVEGLHRLRGVLISVTVYRSVDKVKDLLEVCGGDMTSPMVWPQLKYASFMFNSITALDDSLRLLTHVEVLDLSHNSLESCGRFLEYLGDVHQITLAYNFLTRVPSVSATARGSLTCLVLRGNNLDDINGVEVLTALRGLDLGENCISEHSCLNNLGPLIRLKQLQLDGNPVFYHKQHRLLTVARLALPAVSVEFELDKKMLTAAEISKAEVKRDRASHLSYVSGVMARSHTPDSGYYLSASSDVVTENESVDGVVAFTSKKKGKRKRLKARHMEISDAEHSEDMSSSRDVTPGTSPHPQILEQQLRARREESIHTQREVEELRRLYKSNWLQAIEDRDIFNKKKAAQATFTPESSDLENTDLDNHSAAKFVIGSDIGSGKHLDSMRERETHNTSGSDNQACNEVVPTDDDLYLTDTGMRDAINPIMAAIARLAAGHSSDSIDEGKKPGSGFTFPSFATQAECHVESKARDSFMGEITENNGLTSTTTPSCSVFGAAVNTSAEISSHDDSVTNHHKTVLDDDTEAISPSIVPQTPDKFTENNVSLLSTNAELTPAVRSQGEGLSTKAFGDLNTSAAVRAKMSADNTQTSSPSLPALVKEEEEMTEPVFAMLPSSANEMIILTLTASYLVEKDIHGRVSEKLELASLTGMDWRKVARPHSQSETSADVTGGDDSKRLLRDEVDGTAESIQLELKFDYVRRDRQSRGYIVDFTDGNVILAYLQPFLESREDREKVKSIVPMQQCLKCNRTFLKSESIQQRSQRQLPTSGSSKDLQSLQELMNKTTTLCPKCGSSLIIELEQPPGTIKSTGSAVSTPVGSYTSAAGSYIDQAKRPSALVRNKSLDTMTAVRGRTHALVTDTCAVGTSKISERSQLVCVEDYFSADNMATIPAYSDVADMTTSLQGDSTTRGRKAFVKRTPLKETQSRDLDQNESKFAAGIHKHLIDSGYESGIINGGDTISRPIAIERRASSHEGEDCGETATGKVRSGSRSSVHANLAAMEEIVNSLVKEGRCLEEEGFSSSPYGSSKGKSVSISAFMKSSLGRNRKASIVSIEGGYIHTGLKHSESSSSITVIPVPTSGTSFEALSVIPPLSSSLPSEATRIDDMFIADSDRSASTISPLSSNICSSMVSSIYEASVNNPGAENEAVSHTCVEAGDIGHDSHDGIQTLTGTAVIMVGSSCSSCEDITSIYDHPREPNLSSRQKLHSKHRVLSPQPAMTAEVNGHAEGSALCVQGMPHDSQEESVARTHMPTGSNISYNTAAFPDSEGDSDTDEGNEEDLVPQYAFHHLNHRLALYMMMSLFTTDEEFVCKLQGEVVQYIVEKSYEGLLVMSSARFYILKITSEDHSQPPDHWLHSVEIQPIPELRYIDIGLGGQTFRLEFVTDCSSYTFITRNRDKTVQFVELLHTHLARYAVSQGIASHVVVSDDIDQTTLSNLDRDVVSKLAVDQKLLHYCLGFIERGNQKMFPVSFVITTSDVCLVCVNQQWPQPRLQAAVSEETVGKQFTVLERQKVSNVAAVEVCETTMKKIRLELFNETEGTSTNWNITLASKQSTVDFINALSQPWAKEFGVEMDISYATLPF